MKALIDMGIEYLGWHVRPDDGDGLIHSRQIAKLIRDAGRRSSLLVHSRKLPVLAEVAEMVRPDFLLLSSDRDDALMPELARSVGSDTKLMMSVPVRPAGSRAEIPSLAKAQDYQTYAGALTVDTALDADKLQQFGCTGKANDWVICKDIVSSSRIPVVLAGGLSPENVADAIRAVAPPIVDACTSLEMVDKSKDLARCRAFVDAVRSLGVSTYG
jgi:phosphoribosylanthranilate isomerase